ncbi:MAG TPA: hypothetical protein VKJ01_05395 [Candidatus Solibacter sp.]|nr:hypothetical protein [Candidatus Solibacter sp.]
MNPSLIAELVRLRYKLMWAKTRSRNGRIALFLAGYILLVMLIALLTSGGFGAALVAVRSGKAEMVARAVLGVLFLEGLIATTILGFGMNAIFSETELRRYPVNATERRVARHLIGIVDPFWFLFLALEVGLAVGLYAAGAGSFWLGFLAALLLFLCNYLAARVLALIVDRVMQRKSGAFILLAVILSLSLGPSLLIPAFKENPQLGRATVNTLRYTPPFGAAAAMVRTDSGAVLGLGTVVWWGLGLGAALVVLERRPPRVRVASQSALAKSAAITFDGPFDRLAATLFDAEDAPLVAHWLRFYARNNRFRTFHLLSLPLVAFMTFAVSAQSGAGGLFATALGTIGCVSFLASSRISLNLFGYVGGAFRRYFLLPTDPSAALRTGSYASLLLSASILPFALLAWAVFAPVAFDPRKLFMLAGTGTTGLFVFHGLGLWVTLFNPRRGNYSSSLGNDLSLGGNIVLMGGVMTGIFLPKALLRWAPAFVSAGNWWEVLPLALAGIGFYVVSLKAAGPLFVARREKLLAVVEGRG